MPAEQAGGVDPGQNRGLAGGALRHAGDAERGLDGVEPEGKFCLLCWDVLGAAEFRFNEAKLLGHAVGMDVDQLLAAGLIEKSGEKIKMLSVVKRRRSNALEQDEIEQTIFGPITREKKHRKRDILKVHPNDPIFRTALDGCHALALRFIEAGSQAGGIGSAKALIRQQGWAKGSAVARLMEALVKATPEALKFEAGKKSAAAEFFDSEKRIGQVLLALSYYAENEEVPARIGGARSGEVRTTNSVLYLDPLPVGASEVGENLVDDPLKDFLR